MIPTAVVGSVLLAGFVILAVHHGSCTGCARSDPWKLGSWKEQLAGCCWQELCGKDMEKPGSHGSGEEPEPAVREIAYLALGHRSPGPDRT